MMLRARTRHARSVLPAAGLLLALSLAPLTASADTDLTIGGTGVVAYANGDNVRVRTAPGFDADIVTEVAEGGTVEIVDGLFTAGDGTLWYQVSANGATGYMVSDYLANSGGMLSATTGDAMTIDAVNVRSGPSMADGILGTPAAGTWLTLTGENVNGWLSVNYDGYTGYIYGAFLTQDGETAMDGSSAAAASAAPAPTGATGTRYTSDSVNLRTGPGLDQGVISVLGAGVEVSLTGNEANGFVEVGGSTNGWISVDYLATEPPAAPQETSAGQGIVDFAMQFQGYPYVWAGNTPGGFDCSGFTQYVVSNTLGIDITHSTDLQAGYGSSVGWGAWQPGDLIFFVGTYEGGNITHTGVYIGDGLMIHAENPGTGVVISDITSGYYADHYYSATRLV